ncbi:hypothetical protein FAUST_9272 [Fusarium austroamericanum]|uniref:DNA2/NAM7 helicase helicase domain-containing protein n=1 Tax=Fusarium austroamericanum TaxID=282268 RepID=A0AAN5Z2Z2_FUSAU|nr:hypothetical protein FAUST_9272 [Fusarium austroamericanum]
MVILQSSKRSLRICSLIGLSILSLYIFVIFISYSQWYRPLQLQITDSVKPNSHEEIHADGPGQDDTQHMYLPLLLAELWKPLIHPIDDRIFVTDKRERFEVPTSQMRWKKPLGKKVILIDTDTRLNTTEENTILDKRPLHFPTLHGRTGGHLNHYLYAMIHGYDYRLVRAADYPDRHGTWVKPAIAKEALKTHDFVISLDSDAVFTHLNLPIEWLMNLWDIRPEETLVAMAYDLDIKIDYDPRGNLVLNTGFVISQASQRTQEIYERWEDCPRSIPGCEHWNFKWAHEQSAFSHYIRYEFNRTHDVKNIPCSHANGNEFTAEGQCKCQGIFEEIDSWAVRQCNFLHPQKSAVACESELLPGVEGRKFISLLLPHSFLHNFWIALILSINIICLQSWSRFLDSVWAWYSPDLEMTASTFYHITIELLGSSTDVRELTDNEAKAFESFVGGDKAEDFRVLTLTPTLDKACGARVIGFGTPFHGVNTTVDGYVNQDTQISGVASLSEILHRKDFTILVEETRLAPYLPYLKASRKPEAFGYGEVHKWDITRYREQVPKLRGNVFSPRVRFENANERDTDLTQMHRVGEEPVEKTTQFVCLLEPDKIFRPRHWRAARRALRGDASKLEVTFKPSQGVPWSVSWEASHLTFASSDHLRGVDLKRRLPLLLKRPEDNSHSQKFCPFSYPKYEGTGDDLKRSTVAFRCSLNLHSEALWVSAMNNLSSPNILPATMEADPRAFSKQAIFNELLIGEGLWSLQKQGVNVELPSFDIFDGIPANIRDACLKHVFQNDKERVRRYFGKLYFGLGLVSGPPGTGKSHIASIVVILMCLNKSIKHVYVAAASNGATDNIVERIDGMAQTIIEPLLGSDVKHLMLLRGYGLGIEGDNCTRALLTMPFKEYAIWNPSP